MAWHLHVTLLHERFSSSKEIYGIIKIIRKKKEKCVKYVEWKKVEAYIQLIDKKWNTLED